MEAGTLRADMLATPLGRFRLIALLEGISFITLLFGAMPLKYIFDQPLAVRIVGMAHGVLFVGYVLALAAAAVDRSWTVQRVAIAFIASLIPFGNFWFERVLRAEAEQAPLPAEQSAESP